MSNDVHAWSRTLQETLQQFYPTLPSDCAGYFSRWDTVMEQMKLRYSPSEFSEMRGVLEKVKSRKDLHDRDLAELSPANLFCYLWVQTIYRVDDRDTYRHFYETVKDMGNTCLQGDTHRLFFSYVILDRSLKEAAELKRLQAI